MPFKRCPKCNKVWSDRTEFLSDNHLELNGYKADFEELPCGLFFFTHNQEGCHSTMVIEAREFLDLYTGPRYTQKQRGGPQCPLYCLDSEQLARCDAHCECAFVREVIQIIKQKMSVASEAIK